MKNRLHWIAAALAFAAAGANAQQAGSWLARVGATNIEPDVKSGDLTAPSLPGSKADVTGNTQPAAGLTYMVTDNIAIDVPLALPFKHNFVGAGAIAGAGKIGEVRALPVTVLGQYRFGDANAKFRPYVGAGATYAKVYRERSTATLSALTGGSPTTFTVDSKLAFTAEIGASFMVNDNWFIDAAVAKTLLKTTAHMSTGQTLDIKLNPVSVLIGIGMRFH
jgi:outer membrane protein